MSTGSTYGANLYSGGIYSWLTVWFEIACRPIIERNRPMPSLPPANWQPIACEDVSFTRRGNSTHGH